MAMPPQTAQGQQQIKRHKKNKTMQHSEINFSGNSNIDFDRDKKMAFSMLHSADYINQINLSPKQGSSVRATIGATMIEPHSAIDSILLRN